MARNSWRINFKQMVEVYTCIWQFCGSCTRGTGIASFGAQTTASQSSALKTPTGRWLGPILADYSPSAFPKPVDPPKFNTDGLGGAWERAKLTLSGPARTTALRLFTRRSNLRRSGSRSRIARSIASRWVQCRPQVAEPGGSRHQKYPPPLLQEAHRKRLCIPLCPGRPETTRPWDQPILARRLESRGPFAPASLSR